MEMPETSTPLNYFTLEKLKQVLKDNITKPGGFMARIAAKEPNVRRKKIFSWLKQLNSLNDAELRREGAPVRRSDGFGFELSVGGTRKKYRKKYKTRRIKKRKRIKKSRKRIKKSRKRTKKKHRRKK